MLKSKAQQIHDEINATNVLRDNLLNRINRDKRVFNKRLNAPFSHFFTNLVFLKHEIETNELIVEKLNRYIEILHDQWVDILNNEKNHERTTF
jgi:hypothetical protein